MRAPDSQSTDTSAPERPEFRRAHLATIFLQAAYPLTTSEVVAQVYNNPTNLELGRKPLSLDSARRAMKRDIDALKACGLIIVPAGKTDDGQALWQVDRAHSFTQGVALSEVDAVILDIACLPLLDDPGFAERDELRLALAKIDRLFDAAASDALTASSERDSKVLVTVRDALNARRALDIVYTTRDGSEKQRRVAPLAFFDVRTILYVVCATVDDAGELVAGSERTYRIDRIQRAQRVDHVAFEIPDGFDLGFFRKLPFQIGPTVATCTFSIPERSLRPFQRVRCGKGALSPADDGMVWEVEASDIDAAAGWAIANGIAPLSPEWLVDAWRARLEEAMLHG